MVEPATAVSTAASLAISTATKRLINDLSSNFIKRKFDEIKFSLQKGLPKYLEANFAKCATLKTLLNRNEPIMLDNVFVSPNFLVGNKPVSTSTFLDFVAKKNSKVVVTGLAGSGKSVFAKYCFRKVLDRKDSYYPIFFELRSLNNTTTKHDILKIGLYNSIKSCCSDFTLSQFKFGLSKGSFYLILDGFDELSTELKDKIQHEIVELSRDCYMCPILVSSRPSNNFVSWEGFSEAPLLPFDESQAIDYIKKLKFDEEKKEDFISVLRDGLFLENKDFLSNPLLAAMMLLTYDSFGEIPEKRHIFYEKCFNVLVREHDASKGRFTRELFSKLSVDQLETFFIFFCALSYADRIFTFNKRQIEKYIQDALDACGYHGNISDVVKDLEESISILSKDGPAYEFAHRSFQEYFYAKFVIQDRSLPLKAKIEWLTKEFSSDDTVEMIADMDRIYFEESFLLPEVRRINKLIESTDTTKFPSKVLAKFFDSICYDEVKTSEKNEVDAPPEYRIQFVVKSGSKNWYIFKHIRQHYKDVESEVAKHFPNRTPAETETIVSFLKLLPNEVLKVHHSNEKKLLEVDAPSFANFIKDIFAMMYQHLLNKKSKRENSLGAIIRKEYSN